MEEDQDLLDSKVAIHDRHRFELKVDIDLPDAKKNSYHIEAFFFIPKALNINPGTFEKQNFYSHLQRYIRFKTPQISLSNLIAHSTANSPVNRIRALLQEVSLGNKSEELTGNLVQEVKLLGTIIRATFRDQVRGFLADLHNPSTKEGIAQALKELDTTFVVLKELRSQFLHPSMPRRAQDAFGFIDEYVSLSCEEFLTTLLDQVNGERLYPEQWTALRQRLVLMVVAQQDYRRALGYPSFWEEGGDSSALPYRRGVLKKFATSALNLNLEESEFEGMTQLHFSVAAGVAMLFAAVVTVAAQSRFSTDSSMFILIVVVSYILKDRIKDWLKILLSRHMLRSLADHKVKIRDPSSKRVIGFFREAFSFLHHSQVPKDVLQRRNQDNFTSIDEEGKPERVIKYEKEVTLYPEVISRFHERRRDIKDIMRLNVSPWLKNADDPTVEQLIYDRDQGRVVSASCSRVYHINLVLRYGMNRMERFRLIANRDGIISMNEVVS